MCPSLFVAFCLFLVFFVVVCCAVLFVVCCSRLFFVACCSWLYVVCCVLLSVDGGCYLLLSCLLFVVCRCCCWLYVLANVVVVVGWLLLFVDDVRCSLCVASRLSFLIWCCFHLLFVDWCVVW